MYRKEKETKVSKKQNKTVRERERGTRRYAEELNSMIIVLVRFFFLSFLLSYYE